MAQVKGEQVEKLAVAVLSQLTMIPSLNDDGNVIKMDIYAPDANALKKVTKAVYDLGIATKRNTMEDESQRFLTLDEAGVDMLIAAFQKAGVKHGVLEAISPSPVERVPASRAALQ